MKLIQNTLNLIGSKFDAWLMKVGEENRPVDHDYDTFPEDDTAISRSDLIGDERGS